MKGVRGMSKTSYIIHPKSNIGVVVEWFLNKESMSHKKLQKLCYYAEAWSLITLDTDIVPDLEFEAWVHGPVNVETYKRCRPFGWREIMIAEDVKEKSLKETQECLSDEQKEVLDIVWKLYGRFDADTLEGLTHREEPWQKAREGLRKFEIGNNVISKELMKKYYGEKFKDCL